MKTVAIVDDNEDNRLLMRAILEDHYAITEYESGPAALEGLKQALPDLILLDISLPGMDGIEVLSRIRADERLRRLPVIALTANAMAGDCEKYLAAGFDDYVAKPIVDEQIVLDALERLLEARPKGGAESRPPDDPPTRTLPGAALGLVLALLLPLAGRAQDAAPPPPEPANPYLKLSLEELMAVDITSVARKPGKILDAAAAITVITPEDIATSGLTSLPELMRLAPGVEVARINSSTWSVTSRGFPGEHANKLLVLIDGRTVYSPIFSGVYWDSQDVALYDVDRIEVIRGPGGTLWGANAVNGVINVMTRSARETQGGLVQLTGGTEEWGTSARYGGTLGENAWYRVYAKATEYDASVRPGGSESHDGWYHAQGGIRTDWQPTGRDTLTLIAEYGAGGAKQEIYTPTLTPPSTPAVEARRGIGGGFALARWNHETDVSSSWSLQLYFDRAVRDSAQDMPFTVDTVDIDFQHRLKLLDVHDVVWGLGYRSIWDRVDSTFLITMTPEQKWTDMASAFVQDEITLVPERLRLIVGSKFEYNDYTGFEIQPSGRLAWTPDDRQTVWAAVSRAVRTPNRFESDVRMNYAVVPGVPPMVLANLGNRDLESAKLLACELGYRVEPTRRLFVDAAGFYNIYSDLVVGSAATPFMEMAPPPPHLVLPSVFENDMRGTSFGGELAVNWQPLDAWRLASSYSHLHMNLHSSAPGNAGESTRGQSPVNQFTLRSILSLPGNTEADAALYYVDPLRTLDVDRYVRLDVRFAWRPAERLELSVVGQNLLDGRHTEYISYTMPESRIERSYYAAVQWRF
jgi:iron complex outermembrane receptor protein